MNFLLRFIYYLKTKMGIIHSSPIIVSNTTSPVSDNETDITKLRIRIPRHPTCNHCGKFSSIKEIRDKGHNINWYPIYCSDINDPCCNGELIIN
jgi:hypothetical protein